MTRHHLAIRTWLMATRRNRPRCDGGRLSSFVSSLSPPSSSSSSSSRENEMGNASLRNGRIRRTTTTTTSTKRTKVTTTRSFPVDTTASSSSSSSSSSTTTTGTNTRNGDDDDTIFGGGVGGGGRGLFTIPELRRPGDFVEAASTAMRQCEDLRWQVRQKTALLEESVGGGGDGRRREGGEEGEETTTTSTSTTTTALSAATIGKEILYLLDGISRCVCNVIDAAELCRSVHVNPEWRECANRAFLTLSDYISQLNADTTLYGALLLVENEIEVDWNSFTVEERRFAALLRAEFERDGIHLSDSERDEVRNMQNRLAELETAFNRNLVQPTLRQSVPATQSPSENPSLFAVPAKPVEDVLPGHILSSYGIRRRRRREPKRDDGHNDDDDGEGVLILDRNESNIMQSLLKFSSDASLRREIYMMHMTAVPENLGVLDDLIRRRDELAALLGYPSYAHRFLKDKMARDPTTVNNFLRTLLRKNTAPFQQEMNRLMQAKKRHEGVPRAVVEPWDVAFYTGLLKARHDDGYDPANSASRYLTLENCVNGMKTLVNRLFGIRMSEEDGMTNVERWDVMEDDDDDNKNRGDDKNDARDGVRKFVFTEIASGRCLGTMYLDLHPREGKYGHAAHFTVRCGCVVNGPVLPGQRETYQLPIVALVCNVSSSSSSSHNDTDSRLSHGEVETLFHEFGHGLHSLLSRTEFQHMSGTRSAMDFVETPSHLIENYAWDDEFLKSFAVDPVSGRPIPDDILARLRSSRHEFDAVERQNQILYAMFDQAIFGPRPERRRRGGGGGTNTATTTTTTTTTDIFANLHKQNGVPYADGTHWHSRFGHLVTYGAGYYGYLYSQVFAGDIWRHLFEGNSLSRRSGNLLWRKILVHGGAKDPTEMLTDTLGRPPVVDVF